MTDENKGLFTKSVTTVYYSHKWIFWQETLRTTNPCEMFIIAEGNQIKKKIKSKLCYFIICVSYLPVAGWMHSVSMSSIDTRFSSPALSRTGGSNESFNDVIFSQFSEQARASFHQDRPSFRQ